MDDINKYADIWDKALEKGIFKDAPKPAQPRNLDAEDAQDFFGQNLSAEYDPDVQLNEVDIKYWAKISKMADPNYINEEIAPKEDIKKSSDKVGSAHNPIRPETIGKDQEPRVTQNWGTGGKEHFQLEDLKKKLEQMESKLNSLMGKDKPTESSQVKIDSIKKQIDDLSDSLNGNRWSNDG